MSRTLPSGRAPMTSSRDSDMHLRLVARCRRVPGVYVLLVAVMVVSQGALVAPLIASEVSGRMDTLSRWASRVVTLARQQLPQPRVRVNRTKPNLAKPTYAVAFGAAPTAESITAAHLFAEPLIPVGAAPSVDDNVLLARTLEQYAAAGLRAHRAQVLEDYLAAAPASPWRASVAANLGSVLSKEGYFSRAAKYWTLAWDLGKSATQPRERAVAAYALGELVTHHMAFGQVDALQARLNELGEFPISGSAASRIEMARDGLWVLLNRHDVAIFSGPTALLMLMDRVGTPSATSRDTVKAYKAPHSGTTLAELSKLATRAGLRLVARHVPRPADVPVPFVVHFKSEHFSTVVERRDGVYTLRDPALGGLMQMSEAALTDEMTGFVLVPDAAGGVGRAVTPAEAEQVVGHCVPGTPETDPPCGAACTPEGPDGGGGGPGGEPGGPGGEPGGPGGDPGGDPGGGPGGEPGGNPGGEPGGENPNGNDKNKKKPDPGPQDPCTRGMPVYRLHLMSATVKMIDRPCTYTPPLGPSVSLTLRYTSRSTRLPQIPSYGHVGPLWSHDWMSWVEDNNTASQAPYAWENVVVRGDTFEQYNSYSGYTHWRSRATLVKIAHDPPNYERRLPDGTVEVFTLPDRGASVPGRRVFLTSVIDPQGHAVQLDYDAQFRLRSVTDALNQVSIYDYLDPADPLRLTRLTDPFGRVVNLEYDGDGYLKGITDVVGLKSEFGYATDGAVQTMKTPYGVTGFRRGPDLAAYGFRRLEVVDPGNAVQRVEWHISGTTSGHSFSAPAANVPSGYSGFNYGLDTYNSLYWDKKAMAEAPGDQARASKMHWLIREAMAYAVVGAVNARNIPHSIEHPGRPRVWYKYPDQANYTSAGSSPRPVEVARVVGGQTQAWKYAYNTRGYRTSSTDPVGRETTFVYAADDINLLEVRRTTGPGSSVLGASFSNYTSRRRPQTVTDAAGRMMALTYNSAGQLLTATNALNQTTTIGYEDSYPKTITGAVPGSTTTLTYDVYGRIRTITASDNYGVTIDYDDLNRITKQTFPDGTYEEVVYDRLDVRQYRDRLGRITLYFYDASRRLKSMRDPLGRVTTFEWCECGTLDAVIDANGNKTRWIYDNNYRVIQEIRADNSTTTTYTYDDAGRLKTFTDANGQTTVYDYYLDNALQQVSYQNAQQPTGTVTWAFDPVYRRVTSRTDDIGTTTYTYRAVGVDGAFNIESIDGPLANDTISYGYDALGRRTTRTLNGVSVTQAYDALGRPDTLTSSALGVFTPAYVGTTARLQSLTYPNGQTTTYSYLPVAQDLRLQTIHHQAPGGATLSKFDYTYDAVGNILTWRQERNGQTPFRYVFTHDAADQLKTATRESTDVVPTVLGRQLWDYDRGGNRILAQTDDGVFRTTHDPLNRRQLRLPGGALAFVGTTNEPATVTVAGQPAPSDASNTFRGSATTVAGTTTVTVTARDPSGNEATKQYEVDVAGATTTFTHDANGNQTGDGTRAYVWNARNQLIQVTQGGSAVATFTYDGLGRRGTKTTGSVTRTYVYDGSDILEERVSTGDVIRYVHGPAMDNVLARTINGASATYYATDHLGSVVHETDSTGAITLQREYDAWGELKQGLSASGFAFTGREWDAELALYYFRARYYEPSSGRFVSQDPSGMVDGPNLHAYAGGRPTVVTDPTGNWGIVAPAIWVAVTQAARAALVETIKATTAVLTGVGLGALKDLVLQSDEQDKRLSGKEIEKVEAISGEDIHDIKGKNSGGFDLFKKPDGTVVIKPKDGSGPGEPIGVNIKTGQRTFCSIR
jgi:RHS repeat-associated protein